jgi:hypothetical protein
MLSLVLLAKILLPGYPSIEISAFSETSEDKTIQSQRMRKPS